MGLTRKRAEILPATLTVTGQGETAKLDITYFNRKQSEVEQVLRDSKNPAEVILFTVKEWDSEYPLSLEGIKEMDDDRPGMSVAIIEGFHQARRVTREKN